jgi:hypothetical protein
MSTVVQPSAPAAQRGWYRRNWKWATPLLVLLAIVGGGLVYAWPLIRPWFHEQYAASLAEIRKSPAVIEKLGEPISTVRPFPAGSITVTGDRGDANFNFDVKGPKGTAQVSSKSRLMQGQWGFSQLELTFEDNQRIDLAKAILDREGDDTPKFDPNAKQPEMQKPNLPRDIDTGPMSIDFEVPQ